LFVFLQKVIASLSQRYPELAIHLYLEVAAVADRCGVLKERNQPSKTGGELSPDDQPTSPDADSLFQDIPTSSSGGVGGNSDFGVIATEFVTQAFQSYDDELTDRTSQFRCLQQVVGTLLRMESITKKEYQSLITKTAQCAARLAKKPDQSRMVALCSYLFDRDIPSLKDGETLVNPQRVLECLQRSLKVADICLKASASSAANGQGSVQLFVDALEYYVYYFAKGNPSIKDQFVSGLVQLINEHIDSSKDYSDAAVQAQTHYRHILLSIGNKQKKQGDADSSTEDVSTRFAKIAI
jgi:hypothetical protein